MEFTVLTIDILYTIYYILYNNTIKMDEKRHGVNFSEGGTVFRENTHISSIASQHDEGNKKLSQQILV